ncbi:cytokinesis protein 3 [Thelotrema lepadinum]|nr:cytokinesis protein 3 [Thelotrema lepadinum]
MNDRYPAISRGHSPIPPSLGGHGLTPSPLRDAMDDVMSSLHDMGMTQQEDSKPSDPWSPEAFDQFRSNPQPNNRRPQTSMGLEIAQEQDYFSGQQSDAHDFDSRDDPDSLPQIGDYVQRMESRLRTMEGQPQYLNSTNGDMGPPPLPPKAQTQHRRPPPSMENQAVNNHHRVQNRSSMYSLGREAMDRRMTTKSTWTNVSNGTQSTSTNSTTSTQLTGQSLMSGSSAGGVSATSAGSLERRKRGWGSLRRPRPLSAFGLRRDEAPVASASRPETPMTGISYHSSHDSTRPASVMATSWAGSVHDSAHDLGGLTQTRPMLKTKRSGFLKRLVEGAKTGAANARNSIAGGQEVPRSPVKNLLPNSVASVAGSSVARDMGLGGAVGNSNGTGGSTMDWINVRRDVNRSNSLSRIERQERTERCQLLDQPVVDSIDLLEEAAEGDEGIDGMPISEPTNFQALNLQLVDKSARFVTSLPPMTNAISLSQGYVCRPYKSDVQRFRAIFTWVSEKIAWEEDFEGEIDTRRVIQSRRGCSEEVAVLVAEMCHAVGLEAEVVRGYLKPPGELSDLSSDPRPNHFWNAVLVDHNEWRIMDCCLASPTNPKRSLYSSASNVAAESFYFLVRPLEACYTHIPSDPKQQRVVPPIDPTILLSLPCAMAPYFRNSLGLTDYSTSLLFLDGLELMHLHLSVPTDTELYAEVTARAFARDAEGDLYESGEHNVKRALAQVEWKNGSKRYTIKATLPGDEGQGVLNIYAGKRGLMHSIKDNPHPLALSIPIYHTGENPPFEFLTRHPTPHAQRHDLYVAQPQCKRLACNNTYVFSVRQHPSSLSPTSPTPGVTSPSASSGLISPIPFGRPGSAMSMASSSAGSNPSTTNYFQAQPDQQQKQYKPAKLAIQAPGGKILRLNRKIEGGLQDEGGTWETIIKIGEKGVWRGLVLADRSARWCVWGEWECV